MLKKLIGSVIVFTMLTAAAAPFAALAAEDGGIGYEMNSLDEAKLGDGKTDTAHREKELVYGIYGRSASDSSMKVSMNTKDGSRPQKGDNKGLARFDINKTVPLGGVIDTSFYMASDYAFVTNISLIALNGSGEETALGKPKDQCIGRTVTIDDKGSTLVLFRECGDPSFSKSEKLHVEKDRWYKYNIRITRVSAGKINLALYIDNRLAILKENLDTTAINSSLDDLTGIAAIQFGYGLWNTNLGKITTYFDDVKAKVYETAADAPEINGVSITNGTMNFYTPPMSEKHDSIPGSFSTVMFVTDKTTVSDIKKDFSFGGKSWLECDAKVRDENGEYVTDESLPIKNYYLICTADNGDKYYIKPFSGTYELTNHWDSVKNLSKKLTEQNVHGRTGITVYEQTYTKNEYIADNNLSAADATALNKLLIDNGVVYDTNKAEKNGLKYFPVTMSGDFYADLSGNDTTFDFNLKYIADDGSTKFLDFKSIRASDTSLGSYGVFYPNAWNKLAITYYTGTKYADIYVNGMFAYRCTADKTIKEISAVKALSTTRSGKMTSKGSLCIDNLEVYAGLYQTPSVTADDISCAETDYAFFDNAERRMILKAPLTRGNLAAAVGNISSFDGCGLFTDNAKTEVTDDGYSVKNDDTLLIKSNGIWKYYKIVSGAPVAVGKITMTQANGEITDGKFIAGELNVSMPVIYTNKGYKPVMLIASYGGGELKDVSLNICDDTIASGSQITGQSIIPDSADNVKIYLWENAERIRPLVSCISLTKRK